VRSARQDVRERLPLDVHAEQRGGDARLELRREGWLVLVLVERRIAERLGAEGVETGGEVAVGTDRVDERHRRGDAAEELRVDRGRSRRGGRGWSGRRLDRDCGLHRRVGDGHAPVSTGSGPCGDEPSEPGERREDGLVGILEHPPPRGIDRLRVLEVLLEKEADVSGVQAGRLLGRGHDLGCSSRAVRRAGCPS
jgi:hypothetical protein